MNHAAPGGRGGVRPVESSFGRRQLLGAGAAWSATGLAAAACTGGSTAPASGSRTSFVSASGNPGTAPAAPPSAVVDPDGVLSLIADGGFEHLDPQDIYINNAQSIARLMFRALMGWREDPAAGTFNLTPDLAAAQPTHNADNTTWTFTLRTGVKYADGTAVTAADVKYGVERSMDPAIGFGPQYAREYLAGASDYEGPSKGALASIVVPDPQTIEFHLAQPVGTWAELCTLPTFIPVPRARDTGRTYDLHPTCLGPYTIGSYKPGASLVLVPNTHWEQATDPLRSQHFRQVNCRLNVNGATVDEELFADAQGGALATFDSPLPANIVKATTASYASRTYSANTAFMGYIQVSTRQRALQDVRVRQAILYARDPSASLKVNGGPHLNTIATSLAPNFLPGFEDTDVYPDLGPDGNPAKAKQLLKSAGVSDLKVTIPFADLPDQQEAAQVEVQALARAGITLVVKTLSVNSFYSTTANPANHFDLYLTSWGYDIPDASTIYPPLFRGGSNIHDGSYNVAGTNIPSLDAEMAAALKLTPQQALPLWRKVNNFLISQALTIPTLQSRTVTMVGSKVRGAYISPVLGILDVTNAYIART